MSQPSHRASGHSTHGRQSHDQQPPPQPPSRQQPRLLQPRPPPHPHFEIQDRPVPNLPPFANSHRFAQHAQPRGPHGLLQQHYLPPSSQIPRMPPPPPPCPISRPDGLRQNSLGSLQGPGFSAKHPGGYSLRMTPLSMVEEGSGRKYSLDVVQQPKRARMCGFGDKDRRPITPPPCVRLIVTDVATGKEINCADIDHSMYVLNVDLWNEDGTRELNLVRASTGSPCVSTIGAYAYMSSNNGDAGFNSYAQQFAPGYRDASLGPSQAYVQDYQMQSGYNQNSAYPSNSPYGPPQQYYYPPHQSHRADGGALPPQSSVPPYHVNDAHGNMVNYMPEPGSITRISIVGGQPQGMFTRNLIGSLAASAFRLSDTEKRAGIWFVLQDLSVRTEGPFRLRFSFVNVGPPDSSPRDGALAKVNKSRAPVLACCFSEVFNVFSAKKFPGVCESTPLSKTFATQGIKIPIRKESNTKGGEEEDDED
ncbi:hypothetical protein E4U14_001536 [Claviceps sp. LM454 group G7]|nr:hypothetical protein E4U14_001536 [Claviceps sp. LM454 group G7]